MSPAEIRIAQLDAEIALLDQVIAQKKRRLAVEKFFAVVCACALLVSVCRLGYLTHVACGVL